MSLSFLRSKFLHLAALLLGLALLVSPARAELNSTAALMSGAAIKVDAERELAALASPELREAFPRLGFRYVEVLGGSTRDYNCIAHSLGVNRWVNPMTGSQDNPLEPMDKLYAGLGYIRQDGLDYRVEDGKEKVVVYATLNRDGTINNVTHAARQAADGTWTSKLGGMALIRHITPEALRGPTYGTPVAVYVRTASLASK